MAAEQAVQRFPMPAMDVVAALEQEYGRLVACVLNLGEADFSRMTRCQPWDVKALVAHIWIGIGRLEQMLSTAPIPGTAHPAGAAAYYRPGPRRQTAANAGRITAAQVAAAMFPSGHDLALAVDQRAAAALAAARSTDPAQIVRTRWDDELRFDDYLVTRVVEAAVHGLDLTAALNRGAMLTPIAALVVTRLLGVLLGTEPPESLTQDPVAFIEAGTGRRSLSAAEMRAVGALADRFPLLC